MVDTKRVSEGAPTKPFKQGFHTPLTAQPEPRLFNQALAAAYLGLGERSFENAWHNDASLEPLRFGRRVLWDRKALDAWADDLSGLKTQLNFFGD